MPFDTGNNEQWIVGGSITPALGEIACQIP
jgi:hypothetical protein